MISIPKVAGMKFGVFGLGVSGLSTCDALIASGAEVYCWDENAQARLKTKGTEYLAEHPKSWPWRDLAAVVVSPGVPLTHPKPHAIVRKARQLSLPVIGDAELFARAVNALPADERPKIVGVTGSNGKSTTTALIGHLLKEAGEVVRVGGNIGDAVLSLPPLCAESIYVLELSSFQLDLTHSLRLDVAVFLNLSPDHIERHGTIEGYLAAKKRIFRNQREGDVAVIGVDDDFVQKACTELTARADRRVWPISSRSTLSQGAYVLDGQVYCNFDDKTVNAGSLGEALALRGVHNHQNAAAAVAAVAALGVAPDAAVRACRRYVALPHRMEDAGVIGKVSFINDSKATNAEAAGRALDALDDIFWIAGGRAKEGGAASLQGRLQNVRKAYLIGEAAQDFEAQIGDAVECVQCGALDKAIAAAYRDALASDAAQPVVLLSPACASYDQFRNFVERGDAFKAGVAGLARANGEAA